MLLPESALPALASQVLPALKCNWTGCGNGNIKWWGDEMHAEFGRNHN